MVLKQLWSTSICLLCCKNVNLCFIWNGSIVYRVFTSNRRQSLQAVDMYDVFQKDN